MSKYEFSSDQDTSMCIYKITNKLSGKIYIGQTIRKAIMRWRDYLRKSKSKDSHVNNAIRKYGKDSFTFEVLDIAEDTTSLDHKEIFWINHFNCITPNGYNLVSGGTKGRTYSAKSRAKMSESRRRNPSSPRKGMSNSPETRLKISLANKGKESRRCLVVTRNDGRVYKSISAAADAIHSTVSKIVRQIKEPHRTVSGFQFKKGVHSAWDILKKTKKVGVIRSDGMIFKTIEEAAESISAHVASIQSVICGSRNSCYGFTFRRI